MLDSLDVKEINNFIEKNQKDLGYYLDPNKYIASKNSVDLSYTIKYLQSKVRCALFLFVNGSYWAEKCFRKIDLLHPFYDPVEPVIKNIFIEIVPVLKALHIKFNFFKNSSKEVGKLRDSTPSKPTIAAIFSIFYIEFEKVLSVTSEFKRVKEIKNITLLNEEQYPPDDKVFLSPLWELKRHFYTNLKPYLKGFYLHGSLSTMDYIPNWSDVDTLMILKKETILNPNFLIEMRRETINSHKYLYQVDPFQLHGHFLISEFDLDYYPQTFFPLVLFKYAKSFFMENEPLSFKLRDCEVERIATFWFDAVYYFLDRVKQKKFLKKSFMITREKKLFLHRLFTFPVFYLQAKEEYMYKSYSFDKAKVDFSKKDWEIIELATNIMKGWNDSYKINRSLSPIAKFSSKQYLLAINKYYDMKYCINKDMFGELFNNYEKWLLVAINLAIKGWSNIINKNLLKDVYTNDN